MGNSNNHTVCINEENLMSTNKKGDGTLYEFDSTPGELGCFCMGSSNVDRKNEMSVNPNAPWILHRQ